MRSRLLTGHPVFSHSVVVATAIVGALYSRAGRSNQYPHLGVAASQGSTLVIEAIWPGSPTESL